MITLHLIPLNSTPPNQHFKFLEFNHLMPNSVWVIVGSLILPFYHLIKRHSEVPFIVFGIIIMIAVFNIPVSPSQMSLSY